MPQDREPTSFPSSCRKFVVSWELTSNSTAYHPQGDGLVERFKEHCKICSPKRQREMAATGMRNFHLFYFLIGPVCRNPHESPFFLLYGRYPVLPSEILSPTVEHCIEIGSYKEELVTPLTLKKLGNLLGST